MRVRKTALLLGFLLPWRTEILILDRTCLVSPFDVIWPFAAIWLLCRTNLPAGRWPACSTAAARAAFGPLAFTASVAVHLTGASALPAAMILYAMTAGLFLARFDEIEEAHFFKGLAIGMITQLAVSIPAGLLFPELIREGTAFRGLYASKNGLAFLAGILGVRAIDSLDSRQNRIDRTSLLSSAGWFAVVMLTRSRAALLAALVAVIVATSRIVLLPRKWRPNAALIFAMLVMIVGLATGFVYRSEYLPADRLEFASMIVRYAHTVPLFGIGPGSGYGLDLYFKTFLELGYIGIAALVLMIGRTLLLRKFEAALVFALIFGFAHDPTHWPIFWLLLFRYEQDGAGHVT